MYYILFNQNSRTKAVMKAANRLFNKYSKIDDCYIIDLHDIMNQEHTFVAECKKDDVITVCGGDGTVDVFLNKIKNVDFKCKIFVCPCGSGNDLSRDFKEHVFDISELAKKLPKVSVNGAEGDVFVNGIGMGVDSVVCRAKEQYKFANIKKSYFSISLEALKAFRTYSLDITIDGEFKHYDDVWFFVVNNGKYMGGGMKVAPMAKRMDGTLELCIVHGLSRMGIIMIFPFIYLGMHILFKKHVQIIQGKSFQIKPDGCHSMQRDGEVVEGVLDLNVEAE